MVKYMLRSTYLYDHSDIKNTRRNNTTDFSNSLTETQILEKVFLLQAQKSTRKDLRSDGKSVPFVNKRKIVNITFFRNATPTSCYRARNYSYQVVPYFLQVLLRGTTSPSLMVLVRVALHILLNKARCHD